MGRGGYTQHPRRNDHNNSSTISSGGPTTSAVPSAHSFQRSGAAPHHTTNHGTAASTSGRGGPTQPATSSLATGSHANNRSSTAAVKIVVPAAAATPAVAAVVSASTPTTIPPVVVVSVATSALSTLHALTTHSVDVPAVGASLCKQVEGWLMDLLAMSSCPVSSPSSHSSATENIEQIENKLFAAYRQLHTLLYVSLPASGVVVGSYMPVEGVLYRFLQMTTCPLSSSLSSSTTRSVIAARHSSAIASLINDITNSRCYDYSNQITSNREVSSSSPASLSAVGTATTTTPSNEEKQLVVSDGDGAGVEKKKTIPSPITISSNAAATLFTNQDLLARITTAALKSTPAAPAPGAKLPSTVPTAAPTSLHLTRTLAATTFLATTTSTPATNGNHFHATLHDVLIPSNGAWRKPPRNAPTTATTSSSSSTTDPTIVAAVAAAEDRVYRLQCANEERDGDAEKNDDEVTSSTVPPPALLYDASATKSKTNALLVDKYITGTLFTDTKQEMEFGAPGGGDPSSSSPSACLSSCSKATSLELSGKVAAVPACRDTDTITRIARTALWSLPLSSSEINSRDDEKFKNRTSFLKTLLFSRRAEKRSRDDEANTASSPTTVVDQFDVLEPRCLLPTKTALEDFFGGAGEDMEGSSSKGRRIERMCLLERIAMTHEEVQ